MAACFCKWVDSSAGAAAIARIESVQATENGTTALLTYQPDTAEKQLGAAGDLLTGEFKKTYTSLGERPVHPWFEAGADFGDRPCARCCFGVGRPGPCRSFWSSSTRRLSSATAHLPTPCLASL